MSSNTAPQTASSGQPAKEQSPGQTDYRTRLKLPNATGWYCHECRDGPMSLANTPRCIYMREDSRICNHQRCYFCPLHYGPSE